MNRITAFLATLSTAAVLSTFVPYADESKPLSEVFSSGETKKLVSLLERYLEEDSTSPKRIDARDRFEKEMDRLVKKHKIADFLTDMDYLGALFTAAQPGHVRAAKGQVKEFTATENIAGNEWSVDYSIYVPRDYRDEQPWPTIIGLHPEGKTGEWYLEEILNDETLRSKFIIVCPTLAEGEKWHEMNGIIKLLGLVLNQVSDGYFVDKDRTFLDGYADGANSAWILASSFRDIFAGIVARSGAPSEAMAEGNMRYVGAFCALGSEDDSVKIEDARKRFDVLTQAKLPVVLKEVAGEGQSTFTSLNPEIVEWLESQRRELFPSRIEVRTRDRMFGRAYWISVIRTETATDPKTNKPLLARLEAVANREENRIDITSENVYEIELFLNDEIIDLDRPFSVYVNGEKTWEGVKKREWRYLLDRYHSSGDATRLFTGSLVVDIKAD